MALLKSVMKGPNEIVPFDHHAIRYPQLASTKFDGFRCLCLCGERYISPNMKDVRNTNLPRYLVALGEFCATNRIVVDGELWSPKRSFHMEPKEEGISSILTTHSREIPHDIGYYVFDMMLESDWDDNCEQSFVTRYMNYMEALKDLPHVFPVPQTHIINAQEAEAFFNAQIEAGHEGMILRQLTAGYKHGRCTTNQDGMWKFKEFQTHDAMIVGVEQQMKLKSGVERTRNELGHLERRFEQDLYEPAGMVGAFVCLQQADINFISGGLLDNNIKPEELTFKVKPGKGHDASIKTTWWQDYCRYPEKWNGKHVEYKFMPHGSKNKPRIGSLVRFRPDLD